MVVGTYRAVVSQSLNLRSFICDEKYFLSKLD